MFDYILIKGLKPVLVAPKVLVVVLLLPNKEVPPVFEPRLKVGLLLLLLLLPNRLVPVRMLLGSCYTEDVMISNLGKVLGTKHLNIH